MECICADTVKRRRVVLTIRRSIRRCVVRSLFVIVVEVVQLAQP